MVGDIDVNKTEALIRAHFSSLKNPQSGRPRVRYKVSLKGQDQFLAVTDPEVTSTGLQVVIKHQAEPLRTAAQYQAAIVKNLVNAMLGERYAELSRQANPPFNSGSAGIGALMNGIDIYTATLEVKPGLLEAAFKCIWRETVRVKRFGFTQSELGRAEINYLAGIDAAIKEADKTPWESYVKEYQNFIFNGTAAPGIKTEYQLVKKALPLISLATVNALIKDYV